jgi:sulfite reductase alpha subunit-like flavoprotein
MMKLELDPNSLASKSIQFALLTVATSKCNNSASALRESIKQTAAPLCQAFLRVGAKPVDASILSYLDAGVENVEQKAAEFISALKRFVDAAVVAAAPAVLPAVSQASSAAVTTATAQPTTVPACATRFLWTGDEAREAADALVGLWAGATCDQLSSLKTLTGAAQKREQVVLAVECAEGNLSDDAMGLLSMLRAMPLPLQAQLRQLRFAMLVVAATDTGNAGERASTNSTRGELTQVVAPIEQALVRFGGKCVASCTVDLQDTDGGKLEETITALQGGFTDGAPKPVVTATTTVPSPVPLPSLDAVSTAPRAYGTPLLKIAAVGELLPAESGGEGSDVLARFYFEADKAKVLKVRELRQQPNAEGGLATAEVEMEAIGGLKGYGLGGTLSLVPENDPDDVTAMLPLLGLTPSDLDRSITFTAAEGNNMKAKQPFPTPCTLRTALLCYCDLGKPPNKKMLQALQPKLQGDAHSCVERLLANAEALKLLHSPALCCRMHEFWALLGIAPGSISANDFFLTCPRQKPREFTIASSPRATPDRIALCVSVTSQQVPEAHDTVRKLCECGCFPKEAALRDNRDRFFGICSRWLTSQLKVGDTVLAKHRPSPLHLPEKDVPVIMVGAGAGVAPFRGFWEELRISKQLTAPVALFFGCRHPEQDWLFKEEMTAAVKLAAPGSVALARMQRGPKRPLEHLYTAFSRPGEGQQGKYVQNEMRAQGKTLKIWIEKCHGAVFICGSSAMGNGVLEVLSEILDGGREAVEALRKENRIVAEMWG